MVWDLVQCNVVEGIFESPVRNWIAIAETTWLPRCFIDIQPSPLISLPSGSASDDDLSSKILETSLKWFDLAKPVILLNVGLPQVRTIYFVIHGFGLCTIT